MGTGTTTCKIIMIAINATAIITAVVGPSLIPCASSWKNRINPAPAAGIGALSERLDLDFFFFIVICDHQNAKNKM